MGTVENNGSGCFAFDVTNVSLPGYDSAATMIVLELAKVAPHNGIESLTSNLEELTKYEWEYDVDSNVMRGQQIAPIGGLYSEKFTVCCAVIENSSCDSLESVGFSTEAIVLQGNDGIDSDNFLSGYTCTLESVSSVDNSENLDPNVRVYPNPTSGQLFIDSALEVSRVEIYNTLGAKIRSSAYRDEGIRLTGIANGYYICRILNSKNELIGVKEFFVAK